MVERDFDPDGTPICEGCVDAVAKAMAMTAQIVFLPAHLSHASRLYGGRKRILEMSIHIQDHMAHQLAYGCASRSHTCGDEPARCEVCLLPLVADRCLNPFCGFHTKDIVHTSAWSILETVPIESVVPSDRMFHSYEQRSEQIGFIQNVYVRLDGVLFMTQQPLPAK